MLKAPQFLLAVAAQFACVGAQVGSWSYFIPYVQSYTHQTGKSCGIYPDCFTCGLRNRSICFRLADAFHSTELS